MTNIQKTYALILGIILLIIGIWGLFTDSVLSLGVNIFQSILYIITGSFGLYVGIKGNGPGFNIIIGWFGVILGMLGFIPIIGHEANGLLNTLLNTKPATSWLHLLVGAISLVIYYGAKY